MLLIIMLIIYSQIAITEDDEWQFRLHLDFTRFNIDSVNLFEGY